VAACCAAAAIVLWGSGSWWLPRVILLLEAAADVSCFQLVVADTSWRTRPQPFPVRWLIPAIAVIAATTVIGLTRYPHLPAHLAAGLATSGGRPVPRSPASAFAMVIGQLYVTGMWTGLMMLIYRSRPDIDTADPAASLRRYRGLLHTYARAALTMLALVDLTFLLAALQQWQLCHLHGASGTLLLLLPAGTGVLVLIASATRAARDSTRPAASGQRPGRAATTGRDDDRLWKAGLVYINRTDPAIMVPARFGVGWTVNFGNPAAWLIIAAITATVAGLAVIRAAAGM
jgi:uncharacterized membrane protein